ncbi:MAG TPA: hypothetical protein DD001_23355 [Microcoleaceae bacterium UBA10368]|nr:hypothetical protein [Microcoleaceae cyanobacterium UBA10368]HCV30233.1 hypothetical protein [Microcoleaceae cyanobacterium UBA9251]
MLKNISIFQPILPEAANKLCKFPAEIILSLIRILKLDYQKKIGLTKKLFIDIMCRPKVAVRCGAPYR